MQIATQNLTNNLVVLNFVIEHLEEILAVSVIMAIWPA